MDVMESPIEKPQRRQKAFYSGKQKDHTLKTQVIIEQKALKIICLAQGKGKTHDFRLLKTSGVKFGKLLKVIADKVYQGITKTHELSQTPLKKPRGGKLTSSQKKYNRELNRLRIVVEHINRSSSKNLYNLVRLIPKSTSKIWFEGQPDCRNL